MRYAIVIENAGKNFSAYVPDLPGCVATGATPEEVEREIREAIEFHIEGLRADGLPVPKPSSAVRYVDTAPDMNREPNMGEVLPFIQEAKKQDSSKD